MASKGGEQAQDSPDAEKPPRRRRRRKGVPAEAMSVDDARPALEAAGKTTALSGDGAADFKLDPASAAAGQPDGGSRRYVINGASIVNDEYCSACTGEGSLICCETCPRSFHFTCVDPPIDPDNVPDEDWYCNECQARTKEAAEQQTASPRPPREVKTMEDIWDILIEKAKAMNPKVFALPKRIRRLAEEDEELAAERATVLARGVAGEGGQIGKILGGHGQLEQPPFPPLLGLHVEEAQYPAQDALVSPRSPRERICLEGHCHKCCRSAGREPYQQLIRCDACSLLWHPDCLPYALPVYPSSHRPWHCPVHLTIDNLVDVLSPEAAERVLAFSKGQQIRINDWPLPPQSKAGFAVLPEFSVRLQFGWSLGPSVSLADRHRGCSVPEQVKLAYEQMRTLPAHQARLLCHYDDYSYMDQSVETDSVGPLATAQ